MARFGFSTNDWREYFEDPNLSIVDPTRGPAQQLPNRPCRAAGGRRPGGEESAGSGKSNVFPVAPIYQIVAKDPPRDRGGSTSAPTWSRARATRSRWYRSRVTTSDPLGRKKVLIVASVDDSGCRP